MSRAVVLLALLVGACDEAGGPPPGGGAGEEPAAQLSVDRRETPVQPDGYPGQWMCRTLLQASGVEALSRCPGGSGEAGHLELPGRAVCLRDSYVFTAIAYCWRSECLARQGVTEADVLAGRAITSPERESIWARQMLEDASQLCAQAGAADACTTSGIVSCSP
jgi:hypothetical protein